MAFGDVFVSTAGSLRFKKIIHAVGPRWQGGSRNEEGDLRLVIKNIVERAHKMEMRSVAMPAISMGDLGFPMKQGAEVIISELRDYCQQHEPVNIHDIFLVDMNAAVVKAFSDVMTADLTDADRDVGEDVHDIKMMTQRRGTWKLSSYTFSSQ